MARYSMEPMTPYAFLGGTRVSVIKIGLQCRAHSLNVIFSPEQISDVGCWVVRLGLVRLPTHNFYCLRVGQLSRYSQMLLLPLGYLPCWRQQCSTQSVSQHCEVWRVFTATDVENVKKGQGVPDHQLLPISGTQHVQAFCQLFQGFTARAVCSGYFSC